MFLLVFFGFMRVVESISASNNFSIWNGEVLSVYDFSKTLHVLALFCYDIKMFATFYTKLVLHGRIFNVSKLMNHYANVEVNTTLCRYFLFAACVTLAFYVNIVCVKRFLEIWWSSNTAKEIKNYYKVFYVDRDNLIYI